MIDVGCPVCANVLVWVNDISPSPSPCPTEVTGSCLMKVLDVATVVVADDAVVVADEDDEDEEDELELIAEDDDAAAAAVVAATPSAAFVGERSFQPKASSSLLSLK